MRILNDYSKRLELLALLVELDMDYHKELSRAIDKKDAGKAMRYIELKDCIDKLMLDIEN